MIWMKRVHILKVGEEPADFPKRSRSQIATSVKTSGSVAENLDKGIVGNIFSRRAASAMTPRSAMISAASRRAPGNRDVAALRLYHLVKLSSVSGRQAYTTMRRGTAKRSRRIAAMDGVAATEKD